MQRGAGLHARRAPRRQLFQGVLDGLSSSGVGAYSLRRLRAAYSGAAINVRRSSDNAAMDIGFTGAGDFDALTAILFVGAAATGYVTTWYDQSGNGYNATQSSASSQPIIVSSGAVIVANGRPSISFAGGPYLTTGTISPWTGTAAHSLNGVGSGNGTLIALGVLSGASGNNSALGAGNTTDGATGPWYGGWGQDSPYVASSYQSTSMQVLSKTWAGGGTNTVLGFVNGASALSVASVTYNLQGQNIYLGIQDTGLDQRLNGYLSEAVAFFANISTADRHILERNQGSYFGITVS